MKKWKNPRWICLVLLLAVGMAVLSVTVAAEVLDRCMISAETVMTKAGDQVEVQISISENPGFTNLGIALDYDRERLELVSLTAGELCGELAGTSVTWSPAEDENAAEQTALDPNKTYGYLVCASEQEIEGNGTLVTAVFRSKEQTKGQATVTPIVNYMRNNTATFSVFAPVGAEVTAGAVSVNNGIPGDFDQDGVVMIREVLVVLAAYKGTGTMTDEQMQMIDTDQDGVVMIREVLPVLAAYKGN